MAKLPIPRRRRPPTPAERALSLLQQGVKLWASTKAVKAVGAAAPKRTPLLGLGLLGAGAFLIKKLRGGKADATPTYTPPAPAPTVPRVDPNLRTPPHGDPASGLPSSAPKVTEVPPIPAPESAGDVTESGAPASSL